MPTPKLAHVQITGQALFDVLTVPVGKVCLVHALNIFNDTGATRSFQGELRRGGQTVQTSGALNLATGSRNNFMTVTKKVYMEAGDVLGARDNSLGIVINPSHATVYYTEFDVGEIPGIAMKAAVGQITDGSRTPIITTNQAGGVNRMVVKDLLYNNEGLSTVTMDTLIGRADFGFDVKVDRGSVAVNNTGKGAIEDLVVEAAGVNDATLYADPSAAGTLRYWISYFEHTDV